LIDLKHRLLSGRVTDNDLHAVQNSRPESITRPAREFRRAGDASLPPHSPFFPHLTFAQDQAQPMLQLPRLWLLEHWS
jgi:hypothetical protein